MDVKVTIVNLRVFDVLIGDRKFYANKVHITILKPTGAYCQNIISDASSKDFYSNYTIYTSIQKLNSYDTDNELTTTLEVILLLLG